MMSSELLEKTSVVDAEREKRMQVLKNVIFDLQKVQNSRHQIYHEKKEDFREFQDHLKRYGNFINFKIENPYGDRDLEFENKPSPRAH